jgi:hypothetical protein
VNFQYHVFGIIAAYFQPCNATKAARKNYGILHATRDANAETATLSHQPPATTIAGPLVQAAANSTVLSEHQAREIAMDVFDSSAVKNSRF